MKVELRFRRNTSAYWAEHNPVPGPSEPIHETNTNRFKIGNDVSLYTLLPYFIDANEIDRRISAATFGGTVFEHVQTTPSSTWIVPHEFGRRPSVTLFDVSGEIVNTDIVVTTSQVSVIFPSPALGSLILT